MVASLDERERAFVHELAYGTTRLRGRIDHLLEPHVHRGLPALDPVVLETLRLGAYQLFWMGGVPAFAAVSESVALVRHAVGPAPAGLVNAVLRRVQEAGAGPERFPDAQADPTSFLSSWGSHPRWLVERWVGRWGVAAVSKLVEADNARPPTYLVPLEVTPEAAVGLLAAEGLTSEVVGAGTGCVRLLGSAAPARVLAAIPASIVQDPAANLVTRYADVPRGSVLADLCAAPGGKVLALSDRPLHILAADRSEARIHMVRDNARRAGRSISCVVADALHPPVRGIDVVLLDVPCTGTGTLARHPDARWRLAPHSVGEMAELQSAMLRVAAEVVVPGGILVYSTCSLEPEENEERVLDFLAEHRGFELAPSEVVPPRYLDGRGFLRVTPHESGFDGAFAARLRRIA